MAYIRFFERPAFRNAVLIVAFAGWNDASQVATWAARYLVRRWSATKFAEIEPEEFYVFSETRPMVFVDKNSQRQIRWPANEFYHHRSRRASRDIIVLLGVEPNLKWQTFIETLMDLIKEGKVELVVTLGGLLAAVPHSLPVRLTGSTTDPRLLEQLNDLRVAGSRYQGPTGITGVLNSACQREGIPTASIWGNVPHYLSIAPNLKVSAAILRRLNALLDLNLDLSRVEAMATRFDARVAQAVAGNAEIAAYVRQLEELGQQAEEEIGPQEELPSGEVLIKELEEFLRQQRGDTG